MHIQLLSQMELSTRMMHQAVLPTNMSAALTFMLLKMMILRPLNLAQMEWEPPKQLHPYTNRWLNVPMRTNVYLRTQASIALCRSRETVLLSKLRTRHQSAVLVPAVKQVPLANQHHHQHHLKLILVGMERTAKRTAGAMHQRRAARRLRARMMLPRRNHNCRHSAVRSLKFALLDIRNVLI